MFKKKGNKKEGYVINRTYTKGHSEIKEPIMAKINNEEQVLVFDELELLSDSVAIGTIADGKLVVYETNDGADYSILAKVIEYQGLNSYETFIIGIDLQRKEHVVFKKSDECPLRQLKLRVRDKRFITGEDIMLYMCDDKLKILNFNCEKLATCDNLAFMRGTYAGKKSNWVLNTQTGILYKTTASFSFESVISIDMVEPYILFETTEGNAFAVVTASANKKVRDTDVIMYEGNLRFKEYHFDKIGRKGVIYCSNGKELLNLEGLVCTKGYILNFNNRRYYLTEDFELEVITPEVKAQANKELQETLGISVKMDESEYSVYNNVLMSSNPLRSNGHIVECDLFDSVKSSETCEIEFLMKDYLLQKYRVAFEKNDFTKMFDTPGNKVGNAQNGFSTEPRNYQLNVVHPRRFKDHLVFKELSLQQSLVVDLRQTTLARKSNMEFIMPIGDVLLGVIDGSLCVELNNLSIKCDLVKFTPVGLMVMGGGHEGYSAFLIKDSSNVTCITEDKFVSSDYYAVYDVASWKTAYSKSLPSKFVFKEKLKKMNAF